jgi:hypothetical protein
MTNRKTKNSIVAQPGANNPIGNAGNFGISGNNGAAGSILRNLGTRLNARGMSWNAARAALEVAKVEAQRDMTVRSMELQAEAEAQQREHEAIIKTTRMNNTHEIKKINTTAEQGRLNQLQSTNNVHGVLDRLRDDFPDSDLDFKTERGESVRITRPREASSEDSEGGSPF